MSFTVEEALREGNLLVKRKRYLEALECFQHVVSKDKRNLQGLQSSAICLRHLGRHQEAIAPYTRYIALEKDLDELAAACFFLAKCYVITKRYKKALGMLNKALRLKKGRFAEAWLEKAQIYYNHLDKPGDALACCRRAKKHGLGDSMNEPIKICKLAKKAKPGVFQTIRQGLAGPRRSDAGPRWDDPLGGESLTRWYHDEESRRARDNLPGR